MPRTNRSSSPSNPFPKKTEGNSCLAGRVPTPRRKEQPRGFAHRFLNQAYELKKANLHKHLSSVQVKNANICLKIGYPNVMKREGLTLLILVLLLPLASAHGGDDTQQDEVSVVQRGRSFGCTRVENRCAFPSLSTKNFSKFQRMSPA